MWPKAPSLAGALGHMSKNFQVYFIRINSFKNTKQKILQWSHELYCDATIFVFWIFIVDLPKKMEIEKWPKAANSDLLTRIVPTTATSHQQNFQISVSCHSVFITIVYSMSKKFQVYFIHINLSKKPNKNNLQ